MAKKILLTNRGIHAYLPKKLSKLGFECHFDYSSSKEEIEQKIADYFGLVMKSRFNADKSFLKKAKNLRFLARAGVGFEHIDIDFAKKKNIKIILSPEGSKDAVGEHAVGLLLCLLNNLVKGDREIRAEKWTREPNRGIEIKGKTIGIIGYGNMGQSFAKKLSGFSGKVIAYDKFKKGYGDNYAKEVSLKKILKKSDIISLHIPYSPANHYFVNRQFFKNCENPIYLINTARGLVLNTADLVKAMKKGKVLGAALDVLEYEEQSFETFKKKKRPAPFKYLIQSDRVVLSPHIAGWTQESKLKHAQTIVRKIMQLVSVFFFCFPSLIFAQTVPRFVPDDFQLDPQDVGCICTPGVINKSRGKGLLIDYTITSGGDFTPDVVDAGVVPSKINHLGLLKLRLKAPIFVRPRTKILLGLDHFREKYRFDFIQPLFAKQLSLLDDKILKSTRLTLFWLQSIGETNYLGLRARVSYNGNYQGVLKTDKFYRLIKISGVWGIKKREDIEWGIGLLYSDNFVNKNVLPFLLYNNTFNERWGVEVAFPVSVLFRYNFNPRSLLLFGPEFSNASYALRGEDNPVQENDYFFRHTEIQFSGRYEQQIFPWIWGTIQTGFQINFDSEMEDAGNPENLFEPDLKTGVFIRFGLFLSPPD